MLDDAFNAVNYLNDDTVFVTVPDDSSVPFKTGTYLELRQLGQGAVDITGANGVSVNSLNGYKLTEGQYSLAFLRKLDTNSWLLSGDLIASNPPVTDLSPSAAWDGAAGSGFTTTPTDPVRVTAKPAVQLIVPANQRFTDTLIVGVAAFAINGRSLIDGVSKVTFYLEGNTLDVEQPTVQEFTRADGSTYECLGYWVSLKKPEGTAGAADLYVEAVPTDSSMQNRVIGPFAFYPQDTLYDQDVTVGAAGDYSDLGSAINALKGLAPDNARIQLIDNGDYAIGGGGSTYFGNSYLVIEPAEGVSARITDPTGPNPGAQGWRPRYDRMWLRDVTIDMNTIEQIYDEGPSDGGTENHVLERCKFEATRELWFGGVRGVSYMVRGMPEFLECDFTGCYEVGNNAKTMRGNTGQGNWGDFTSQCPTVLYNDLDDQEFETFAGTIDAVTVNYVGVGLATLSKTRNSAGPADNRTEDFVMKVDGVQVGTTLQMWRSASKYDLNDGRYWNEDFVAWVNGLPDFTATSLLPVLTRQGRPINQPGSTSNSDFADLPIGASITLVSDFDFHTDGIVSGGFENGIHFNNQLTRFDGQGYFLAANEDYLDIICANNVFEGLGTLVPFSQVENGDFEHMVIAHNTWSTQILNFGQGGATYDAYCELSNNVAWNIIGDATGVSADNNHLASDGPQTTASGLTNTVVAGTAATMFVDAAGRDFTPAGELLTSLKDPVIRTDLNNSIRNDPSAVGAVTNQ